MIVVEREATSMAGLTWRNHGSGDPPCQAHEYPGGGHLGGTHFEHSSIIITHHHPPYPECEPLNSLFQHGLHLFLRPDEERSYESESIRTATPTKGRHTWRRSADSLRNLFFTFKNAPPRNGEGETLKSGARPSRMKAWEPWTVFTKSYILREK